MGLRVFMCVCKQGWLKKGKKGVLLTGFTEFTHHEQVHGACVYVCVFVFVCTCVCVCVCVSVCTHTFNLRVCAIDRF
jgi:hypothetical protein